MRKQPVDVIRQEIETVAQLLLPYRFDRLSQAIYCLWRLSYKNHLIRYTIIDIVRVENQLTKKTYRLVVHGNHFYPIAATVYDNQFTLQEK
jgi:hypothetical protein